MSRNIIIIGGGLMQTYIIETARAMQLGTVVFDMAADAPGMALSDVPIVMSTRDIDGCVREARKLRETMKIHGVVTAGTDASRAVAAIAGALDLPGIRYADAEAASNKVLMRKRLATAGVPIPKFFSVWSLREAREGADQLTFPLVIKPADNMGARGVVKVRRRDELTACFRHAKKFSPTGEMILEEFMTGPELSVDALAWDGQFRLRGVADRIIDKEPYFVELGHNMPSALSPKMLEEAREVMFAGMQALGIHTGCGKGDLKVTPEGVKIGEIAARLSGGYMSSHTYPLHSGRNLYRDAIRIALGESPEDPDREINMPRVAIERGVLGEPGKILEIGGLEEMQAEPGVELVLFNRKAGDVIGPATSNLDKVGHIIAVANTLQEAEAVVERARARMTLLVDDAYSVDWKNVETKARERFSDDVCWVCKNCDGANCASGMPGMGGVGRMTSFLDNSTALAELKIIPRYIREPVIPDTSIEFLGRKFELPVMGAPMTGAITNMKGAIGEQELAEILLESCRESGSIAWLGDGASPDKYRLMLEALKKVEGFGVLICKPRADTDALLTRFRAAEEAELLAVGMDIDAVSLKTMRMQNQGSTTRGPEALKKLRDMVNLPFILKGIMTPEDARLAVEIGADAIVVSNHGGRVLDDMPGTARVLPGVVDAVAGKIPVLVDGGIRSGNDVFKMLALGAQAVLVGRPLAIAAVGGNTAGVKYLLNTYRQELSKTMALCGVAAPDVAFRENVETFTSNEESAGNKVGE